MSVWGPRSQESSRAQLLLLPLNIYGFSWITEVITAVARRFFWPLMPTSIVLGGNLLPSSSGVNFYKMFKRPLVAIETHAPHQAGATFDRNSHILGSWCLCPERWEKWGRVEFCLVYYLSEFRCLCLDVFSGNLISFLWVLDIPRSKSTAHQKGALVLVHLFQLHMIELHLKKA